MLKERLNIVFYDDSSEGGGGGGWDLNIDPVALQAAASDYAAAVKDYLDAKEDIIKKFNAIANESSWQDIGNADYKSMINTIISRLDAIQHTLENNSTNLGKIAKYASDTETKVQSSINAIN